jgi:hypothetical protein
MAASAPPSRLVTRNSSIPHLGVGVGGAVATLASWARPDGVQPRARGIATLVTKRLLAPTSEFGGDQTS